MSQPIDVAAFTEGVLEEIFADIEEGLDPTPPCMCGSNPEDTCTPCAQQLRAMAQLARLERYVAALRSRP